MRVRPHIGLAPLIGRQIQRSRMIEKDERAYHATLPERQDSPNGKSSAEICVAGFDEELEHLNHLVKAERDRAARMKIGRSIRWPTARRGFSP